jgi:outer membrane lipoprotein-sorting protein
MKASCRLTAAALCLPVLLLSGCMFSTRKLPIPKAPLVTQTVSADALVARLNERWTKLENLTAKVEIQASVLKTKEGKATDYTTIKGQIVMRKPGQLRVVGMVPILNSHVFDGATDGKTFTVMSYLQNKVFRGSNLLKKKSAKPLENLRPSLIFDAIVVRGLEADDEYMVTAETLTVPDTADKHLYLVPEYILSIMRRKPGTQELTPVRVVRFHRDDLLPYEQDTYDSDGNLETQVTYENYQDFDTSRYPARITIRRPLEEWQVVMTVDTEMENLKNMTDEQFQVKIPEGTPVEDLE